MRADRKSANESLAGSLLLAHPLLRDPNFRRTVVLMTAHAPDGAMGVVLNRPLGRRLGEVSGEFVYGPLASVPVFTGGPVQAEQLILVGWKPQPHGFQLHMGLDPEKAGLLAGEEGVLIRAFMGYSGWSGGQLEKELKVDSWVIADAPPDLFVQPTDVSLWRNFLGREGAAWRLMANEPDDPETN
jgi:putative transcriptional regulator